METFTWHCDLQIRNTTLPGGTSKQEYALRSGRSVKSITARLIYLQGVFENANSAVSVNKVSLCKPSTCKIWSDYMKRLPPAKKKMSKSCAREMAAELGMNSDALCQLLFQIRDVKHALYFSSVHEENDKPPLVLRNGFNYTVAELRTLYDYKQETQKSTTLAALGASMKRSLECLQSQLGNMAKLEYDAGSAIEDEEISLASLRDVNTWNWYCNLAQQSSSPFRIAFQTSIVKQMAEEAKQSVVQMQLRLQLIRVVKKWLIIAGVHEDGADSRAERAAASLAIAGSIDSDTASNTSDCITQDFPFESDVASTARPAECDNLRDNFRVEQELKIQIKQEIRETEAELHRLEKSLAEKMESYAAVQSTVDDLVAAVEENYVIYDQVTTALLHVIELVEEEGLLRKVVSAVVCDAIDCTERTCAVADALSNVLSHIEEVAAGEEQLDVQDCALALVDSAHESVTDSADHTDSSNASSPLLQRTALELPTPFTEEEDEVIWSVWRELDSTQPYAELYLRLKVSNLLHRTPEEITERARRLQTLCMEANSAVESGAHLLPGPTLHSWRRYCLLASVPQNNCIYVDAAAVSLIARERGLNRFDLHVQLQELRMLRWYLRLNGVHTDAPGHTIAMPSAASSSVQSSSSSVRVTAVLREEEQVPAATEPVQPAFGAFKLHEEREIWRAYSNHQRNTSSDLSARLAEVAQRLGCTLTQVREHLSTLCSLRLGLSEQQYIGANVRNSGKLQHQSRPFSTAEDGTIWRALGNTTAAAFLPSLSSVASALQCREGAVILRFRQLRTLKMLDEVSRNE